MHCYQGCECLMFIDVFLDGYHVKDCIMADEETGVVYVAYRDPVTRKIVSAVEAEPGALICDDVIQAVKRSGRVEIKLTVDADFPYDKEWVRNAVNNSGRPSVFTIKGGADERDSIQP